MTDWALIRELEHRLAAKAIFRAKNGKMWPRFCPCCGGEIREYRVTVNYSREDLAAFPYDQWLRHMKDLKDNLGLYLPDIPKETGRWYFVRCENSVSDTDPCPVVTWDWFQDLDEARWDFYTTAQDMIESELKQEGGEA